MNVVDVIFSNSSTKFNYMTLDTRTYTLSTRVIVRRKWLPDSLTDNFFNEALKIIDK